MNRQQVDHLAVINTTRYYQLHTEVDVPPLYLHAIEHAISTLREAGMLIEVTATVAPPAPPPPEQGEVRPPGDREGFYWLICRTHQCPAKFEAGVWTILGSEYWQFPKEAYRNGWRLLGGCTVDLEGYDHG